MVDLSRPSRAQSEWRQMSSRTRRRSNATGRRDMAKPFVRLPHWIFDTAAYRALKPGPRALLWELIRIYNGSNNGTLALGVRAAAERLCIATPDTAGGYFEALKLHGFIVATREGSFSMKDSTSRRATEWRLTWEACGEQPATKEFMRWRP